MLSLKILPVRAGFPIHPFESLSRFSCRFSGIVRQQVRLPETTIPSGKTARQFRSSVQEREPVNP